MGLAKNLFAASAVCLMISPVSAQSVKPDINSLVTPAVIEEMRKWIETDIVRISIGAQNERLQQQTQEQIDALLRG